MGAGIKPCIALSEGFYPEPSLVKVNLIYIGYLQLTPGRRLY